MPYVSRTIMLCFDCKLLFFVSSIFIYLDLSTAQQPILVYNYCDGNNYTTNSPFNFTLNCLISSLSSASLTNRFYNTTAGQNLDTVYGLFLCRGDVTSEVCQSCISTASKEIMQGCLVEEIAIIWYDKCMLRYSTSYIFSNLEETPQVAEFDPENVNDSEQFNQILGVLMNNLVSQASSLSSPDMFVTGKENVTTFQTIYGLVQCTPDISHSDCNRCLLGALAQIPDCCNGSKAAGVYRPSCNLMYSIDAFFQDGSAPPPSSTDTNSRDRKKSNTLHIVLIITIPTVVIVILLFIMCFFYLQRKNRKRKDNFMDEITNAESLQFSFSSITTATNNFSDANKLGVGGFGIVYKGTLPDGQEIAVKRLSRNSTQGEVEFKNEVALLAKLQHRNLVRLLGFCLEGEEKQLIYEFVPNRSLDYFLFDPMKSADLKWERRYRIIEGIARGLLYLHEDSQFRIIHRDLKPSNILLDADMNPKISDFGMARLVLMDQTRHNTSKIVGTFGYMPPEYAVRGLFSVKSDAFSFGVILLEIVSGKKISSFYLTYDGQTHLEYAWRLWLDGKGLEFIDPLLKDSCPTTEVLKCLLIGLLCVQEDAMSRPTMSSVAVMLKKRLDALPQPRQPAFLIGSSNVQSDVSSASTKTPSITLSSFSAR
ncbi:cysteine-rich receptor-like protein kinase 10 [Telopea speciosissima]|uniref:cysteine-rich receptor-like protein kinase 10 n=1 Tax=Telopea speciosissima TaxID=54955 RepID=UPI001CC3FCFB|nr:cysteine-rich receptor-like protein kinase 10 [Telopea speciosissima]